MFTFYHSPIPTSQLGLVTLASLLIIAAGYFFQFGRSKRKLPPGPKGMPFFGIRLSDKGLNDFEEWAKMYGDVMYLNVFGQGGIVVLNSHQAVVDLFDRREYRYRPKLIVVNEFITRQLLLTGTNDDDLWRKMRRVGHEVMNKTVVNRYYEMQHREALLFTENLLRDSTNWYREVHRWVVFFFVSNNFYLILVAEQHFQASFLPYMIYLRRCLAMIL
ncbi:hypothetical protein M413DRAFT_63638 [Hebeloma cylindrosporum]|uniref:Cytochrome P450 n=1 Tax=Hebeloma cylindrosporum TaxID=76867 RepID=A0A0C3CTB6_HEBCY|nr:hypothetical protein M413DRAFT_63638 [Hebeloma cylindrosporum h7]